MSAKRTPQQRAEEQLAIAKRAVERSEQLQRKLGEQLEVVNRGLESAKKRLAYLAANPDLPHLDLESATEGSSSTSSSYVTSS